MHKRVNVIHVGDDSPRKKSCEYCHVRYEWIDRGRGPAYRCPQCGNAATGDDLLKEQSGQLEAAHVSEPLIGKRKKKDSEYDADLPAGANWISDETINPES